MKKLIKLLTAVLLVLVPTSSYAQGTGQLQAGQIWGNPTGAAKPATGTTIGAILDQEYTCNTQGNIIFRGSSLWTCLAANSGTARFLQSSSGGVLSWQVPAGGGNVSGPGSSTTTAIARWNGTLGDTLSNSGVTIDGSNNMAVPASITAGAGVVAQAGQGFTYALAAPARTDYLNAGATGSLANAQASFWILRRNLDNVAMVTVSGFGDITAGGTIVTTSGFISNQTAHTVPINESGSVFANVSPGTAGGYFISKGTGTDPAFVTPASLGGAPANPTGNGTATALMMGLGVTTCRFVPASTGIVQLTMSGIMFLTNSSSTATFDMRYANNATTTAPANGAAVPTSTLIATSKASSGGGASQSYPFTLTQLVTGLTLGATYWFDMDVNSNTGVNQPQSVNCIASEK